MLVELTENIMRWLKALGKSLLLCVTIKILSDLFLSWMAIAIPFLLVISTSLSSLFIRRISKNQVMVKLSWVDWREGLTALIILCFSGLLLLLSAYQAFVKSGNSMFNFDSLESLTANNYQMIGVELNRFFTVFYIREDAVIPFFLFSFILLYRHDIGVREKRAAKHRNKAEKKIQKLEHEDILQAFED